MAGIGYAELAPGLSAFLDIRRLRACEGCLCNTPVVDGVTHGTNRTGPFLILQVSEHEGCCLCVPLYGNMGPSRLLLDQKLKSGPGRGWREGLSYVDLREFWIVPFRCYVEASHIEYSAPGNRQRYAQARPSVLAGIAARKDEAELPFRPIAN